MLRRRGKFCLVYFRVIIYEYRRPRPTATQALTFPTHHPRRGNRSYHPTERQKPDPVASRFYQLKTSHMHTLQHITTKQSRELTIRAGSTNKGVTPVSRTPLRAVSTMEGRTEGTAGNGGVGLEAGGATTSPSQLSWRTNDTGVEKMTEEAKIGYGPLVQSWAGGAGHDEFLRGRQREQAEDGVG